MANKHRFDCADLPQKDTHFDQICPIRVLKQKKVNFFFAEPKSQRMTHFCGLQSHCTPRDSC